jgi:hypothetical protein
MIEKEAAKECFLFACGSLDEMSTTGAANNSIRFTFTVEIKSPSWPYIFFPHTSRRISHSATCIQLNTPPFQASSRDLPSAPSNGSLSFCE